MARGITTGGANQELNQTKVIRFACPFVEKKIYLLNYSEELF
jgi:hypothetical protein